MTQWLPLQCAAALAGLLALQSCTTRAQKANEPPPSYGAAIAPVRLAQLDGRRFSRCAERGCPLPTPKARPGPRPAIPPMADASVASSERVIASATQPLHPPARDNESLSVSFEVGSAHLTRAARIDIDVALARAGAEIRRLVIRGRTDVTGTSAGNERLAQARASAVREHIASRQPGLLPLMAIESHGTCCYVAPNDHAAGRARNRRVEIEIERDTTSPTDDL